MTFTDHDIDMTAKVLHSDYTVVSHICKGYTQCNLDILKNTSPGVNVEEKVKIVDDLLSGKFEHWEVIYVIRSLVENRIMLRSSEAPRYEEVITKYSSLVIEARNKVRA